MPTSARPRKRQQQRYEPGYLLTPNQITDLALIPHMALVKLQMGLFCDEDWMNYGTFANIVQLLAQEAGNTAVVELGQSAALALQSMRQRAERIKRWGCSGAELLALRHAINPMDAFLRTRTNLQVKRAIEKLDQAIVQMQQQGVGMLEVAA